MPNSGYNIKSIASIVNGSVIRLFRNNSISHLSIDSRKLSDSESVLFFALKGPRHDGHQFIRELYERGVRNFVVSETYENIDLLYEANIIRVQSSTRALQNLAACHRAKCNLLSVGITGSNGKTIVKEWLYQLLQSSYRIVRSPKSFNSQVGVPLSVWNIEPEDTLGLFEAGISAPGEMEQLQRIIQPEIGVFINLREAHDALFDNREHKAYEKLKLFKGCRLLIYNSDYPEIESALQRADWLKDTRKLRCSFSDSTAGLFVSDVHREGSTARMEISYLGEKISATIPFNDNGSIENAIMCMATALELGKSPETILPDLESLQPVAMRLQLLEGINGCGIINDTYNSDMGSLEIALDFAHQQKFLRKKTLILSDILQSGKPSAELYKRVAKMCRHKKIDRLIGIGTEISEHASVFDIEASFFHDTASFLENFKPEDFERELVLIKGARPFRFERISRMLEYKSHETVLEINLGALVHNLNFFRSKLSPQTSIMAMVKAFSYGMGSYELAHLLEYNKVSYLAVAYTDEGVELRKSGVKLPVMVMNPEIPSYDTLLRYKLEPEIYNMRSLKAFIAACKTMMRDEPQPIHLKLDTGMHRLGFEPSEIPALIECLKANPVVRIGTAFSHLAAADNPDHDRFTKKQIASFAQMSLTLQKSLGYSFPRHILNTSGIMRFPESQFEMVRLGIGLYGYSENEVLNTQLMPSSRLKTVISQIKHLSEEDTVGYQRAGRIKKASRIATLPVGYADGFSRTLGNGVGTVVINGHRAKTVGNICMDMCMVDVSEIPCKEGDEAEIFGNDIPLQELADKMNTILYEVISGISRRVKRVYFHD